MVALLRLAHHHVPSPEIDARGRGRAPSSLHRFDGGPNGAAPPVCLGARCPAPSRGGLRANEPEAKGEVVQSQGGVGVCPLCHLTHPCFHGLACHCLLQSAADATFRLVRQRCESTTCAHLPEFESDNCIHECMSPSCYQTVYAAEPVSERAQCRIVCQLFFERL